MNIVRDEFVELNRKFCKLPTDYSGWSGNGDEDTENAWRYQYGESVDWNALLEKNRVIILSEAGSGKTEELRQATLRLRAQNKAAFFLRLEHMPNDFTEAFEEGSYDEFLSWIDSSDEGWLLLDSIDEARLSHPKDFERAIKVLAKHLQSVLQRVHVVITGRGHAWRPKTDLQLCKKSLPYKEDTKREKGDTSESEVSIEGGNYSNASRESETSTEQDAEFFEVHTLIDLTREQVEVFLRDKGVINPRII